MPPLSCLSFLKNVRPDRDANAMGNGDACSTKPGDTCLTQGPKALGRSPACVCWRVLSGHPSACLAPSPSALPALAVTCVRERVGKPGRVGSTEARLSPGKANPTNCKSNELFFH